MINKIAGIISIAAIGLFLFASPTAASGRCESLTSLELRDGKITSASLVEAGKFTPPMGGGPMMGGVEVYKNAPAFCRVTATLAPTSDSDIKVEVSQKLSISIYIYVAQSCGKWNSTIIIMDCTLFDFDFS